VIHVIFEAGRIPEPPETPEDFRRTFERFLAGTGADHHGKRDIEKFIRALGDLA